MAPQPSSKDIQTVVGDAKTQFDQNHGDQAVKGLENFVNDFHRTHSGDQAAIRDFDKQLMKQLENQNLLPRVLAEQFGSQDKLNRLEGGPNNPKNAPLEKATGDRVVATGLDGDNKPLSPLQQMAVFYMIQHMGDITGRPNGSITPGDIQGWVNRERQQRDNFDGANKTLMHAENYGGNNTDESLRTTFGLRIAQAQDTLEKSGKLKAIENGNVQGIPSDIAAEYLRTHFSRTYGRGSAMGLIAQNPPYFDRISRDDIENHFKKLPHNAWNDKLKDECLKFFDADKTPKSHESYWVGLRTDYLSLQDIETGRQNAARARAAMDYLQKVDPVDNPNGLTNWQRMASYDGPKDDANRPTAAGRGNNDNYYMYDKRATALIDDCDSKLKSIPQDKQDSPEAKELRERRAALEFVNETVQKYNTAVIGDNYDRLKDMQAYANKLGYRPGTMGSGSGEQPQPDIKEPPKEPEKKPEPPKEPEKKPEPPKINPDALPEAINWDIGSKLLRQGPKTKEEWATTEAQLAKAYEGYKKLPADNKFRNEVTVDYAEALLKNPDSNEAKQKQAQALLTEASAYFKNHPEDPRANTLNALLKPEAKPEKPEEKPKDKPKTQQEKETEATLEWAAGIGAGNDKNWAEAEAHLRNAQKVFGKNDKQGNELAVDLAQAILSNKANDGNPEKLKEAIRLMDQAQAYYKNNPRDADGLHTAVLNLTRKMADQAVEKEKVEAKAEVEATKKIASVMTENNFKALGDGTGGPLTEAQLKDSVNMSQQFLRRLGSTLTDPQKEALNQQIALGQYLQQHYKELAGPQGIDFATAKAALEKKITGVDPGFKWPDGLVNPPEKQPEKKPEKEPEKKVEKKEGGWDKYIRENVTEKGGFAGAAQYGAARDEAARTGKDLVVVVGSRDKPQMLQGVANALLQGDQNNRVYLYLDAEKMKSDTSEFGSYVRDHLPAGTAKPYHVWQNGDSFQWQEQSYGLPYFAGAAQYNPQPQPYQSGQPTYYQYQQQPYSYQPYQQCQPQQYYYPQRRGFFRR